MVATTLRVIFTPGLSIADLTAARLGSEPDRLGRGHNTSNPTPPASDGHDLASADLIVSAHPSHAPRLTV